MQYYYHTRLSPRSAARTAAGARTRAGGHFARARATERVIVARLGMDAHGFLVALTIVLGVAAVTTVVFQRLRQPVVLGYILAGLIIGPNVPVPLVADRQVIQTLSELGVILLMFSLGLEFSLGKLVRLGPSGGLTALLQSSLMVWL